MSAAPFEPLGDQARWRTVYDVLTGREVGDVVTYADLGAELELDADEDRHAIQMAVRRAAQEYLNTHRHALDAVPNEGYRIVEPGEHLVLAKRHQKRASRALAAGHSKAVHVDLTGMDFETRKAFQVVAQAFAIQIDMTRRLDVGQQKLRAAVDSVVQRTERSESEIAELRARLERLEAGNESAEGAA